MPAAHTDRAWTRPWVVLGLAGALLAALVVIAFGAPGELGIGSLRLAERPAKPAPADAELYVTLRGTSGESPDDRAFRTSEGVVTAQIQSDPAVASVRRIEKRDEVALVAGFGDASNAEREDAAARLAETVDAGGLRATVGGELSRLNDARDELEGELWRKELLVVPLALLLLAATAGLRRTAAPVICAGIAIAGSLALLRLIGAFADVSLLGFAPAAAVGLVLGVELPLRALRAPGAPEHEPRLALVVGVVAALPGFALLATPLDQAASLALGAALAAMLAAGATLLVVPAIASLAPERADPPPPRRYPLTRRRSWIAFEVGVAALCALAVLAIVYDGVNATAAYTALDYSDGIPLARSAQNSLFAELPLAAAIAAGVAALVLAGLARDLRGLLLGPLSLLPAAAALGFCALVREYSNLVGHTDNEGGFFDTGAIAIAVCALAAISCARSASIAIWFSVGRRLELIPVAAATAVGILAAGALYAMGRTATGIDEAEVLGAALAVGLAADLVLLRLPLTWLLNRWIGSARD